MTSLDDIFTHVDILKSREPEINESEVVPSPFDDIPKNKIKCDTPTSFLQIVSMKKYNEPAIYTDEKLPDGRFRARFVMRGMEAEGIAANKKNAKQTAARNLLFTIIDCGMHKEFFIPGETPDDAREYVNSLNNTNLEMDEDENWISNCNQYCQRKKMTAPQFKFTERRHENGYLFTCTVVSDSLNGEGTARFKKAAQQLACKELYEKFVDMHGPMPAARSQLSPSNANIPTQVDSASEVTPNARSLTGQHLATLLREISERSSADPLTDYESTLKTILNSKDQAVAKVFDLSVGDKLQYTFMDTTNNDDEEYYQVSLEIRSTQKGRTENVFAGQGPTQRAAREDAAFQALQFLYLFGNFVQK